MLKRVLYHIRKSGGHVVFTFVIYTFVLFFFCVSLLITNIGDMQKYLFSNNMDLYVSMSSSLQLYTTYLDNVNAEELLEQNKVTLNDYNQLITTEGVTWSCLEQVTNVSSGIWTAEYREGSENPYFVIEQ